MLKSRIITAALLFLVFFSALFLFSPLAWGLFATLIAALAAWEWGGLLAWKRVPRVVLGAVVALLAAGALALSPEALGVDSGLAGDAWRLGRWFYFPAAVFWVFVVPLWLWRRWTLPKSLPGVFVGLLVILPTWLALVQLRQAGGGVLIAVMALAWVSDIAAYFVGRSLGRHKLAPAISPGKTWEGAVGGGVAVLVYGLVLAPKLPGYLSASPLLLALLLVLLTAIGIVGDLFESLLKRHVGIKDSSRLLPGHGGVLDRIDSLTSILPLVALIWLTTLR